MSLIKDNTGKLNSTEVDLATEKTREVITKHVRLIWGIHISYLRLTLSINNNLTGSTCKVASRTPLIDSL